MIFVLVNDIVPIKSSVLGKVGGGGGGVKALVAMSGKNARLFLMYFKCVQVEN